MAGLFVFVSIDSEQFETIEVIDYPCLSKKMFFLILDEVKSTVTDPGQSHLTAVAIPNLEPGGVGDIGLWDVSSGKKLLSRNFRVWNLDAGPMALKSPDGSVFGENVLILKMGLHMQSALCNYILIMEATTIGSHEAPVYSVCPHTKENVHVRATLGIDVVVLPRRETIRARSDQV
ncbi:unnamed protein product [Prunus armeniaca]